MVGEPARRFVGTPPRRGGFSLLEIVIVVAITFLVLGGLLVGVRALRETTDLDRTAAGAASLLRLARERTIAAEENMTWGVHFTADAAALFSGSVYGGVADDTLEFPQGISAAWALNGGGDDVVFDRIDGTTAMNGTLTLTASSGESRTVTVFVSGEVAIAGALPAPGGTRLSDTRHVHFLLPFSLNGGSTMTLTFSDPPNPNVSEAIDIPSSITGGRFLWEGDVDVYGAIQHLRIVSHSIGVADTNLSVRRDRMDNSKALTIDVDGTTIAIYAADGTLTDVPNVTAEIQ